MATKAQALAALNIIGAKLDPDMLRFDNYTIDLPAHKTFTYNCEHSAFIADSTEPHWGNRVLMSEIWDTIKWICEQGTHNPRTCDNPRCGVETTPH